jgi:MFS family permease
MASDPFALWLVAAAFAGGAFGASVGALASFSFAGAAVVIGEVYALAARSGEFAAVPITDSIGFGVVLGPHVAFGGGAAAAAYVAREDDTDLAAGFPYHPAKNIVRGLGARWDALCVGGAFGVVGHLVAAVSRTVALPADPVALGVVGSALLHRAVFGYALIGKPASGWFTVTETAASTDGGTADTHGPEPWLPYQYRWRDVTVLGVVMGALGGYLAYLTASPFLAFGLSAALLVFLTADVAAIPVTHHMTLPASTAVLAVAGLPAAATPAAVAGAVTPTVAVVVGAGFGLVGGVLGEVCQRVTYAHAETHLDPPAASIVLTSAIIAGLAALGVLSESVWVPVPG